MDKPALTIVDDSSRIVPPVDPERRKFYDEITRREKDLYECKSPNDYRKLLNYVNDATDEFLRFTSKDPYYNRPDNRVYYEPGGWI